MTPAERSQLFKLVSDDHDRTSKFIDGNTTSVVAVRGWAITIWLAVLGVAFSSRLWEMAALDFLVIVVFGVIDGYYSYIYSEALDHAKTLENIWYRRYVWIAFGSLDPGAEADLEKALEAFKVGVYKNLRRFRPRDIWFAQPTIFFRWMYPFLAVASVGTAIFIATVNYAPSPAAH